MTVNFQYSYKDTLGNEKANIVHFPSGIELDIEKENEFIRQLLIDGRWFSAVDLCLPELFFEDFDPQLDHGWHEFVGLTFSNFPPREIQERWEDFLERLIEIQFEYRKISGK
jgi:hypothetical protein